MKPMTYHRDTLVIFWLICLGGLVFLFVFPSKLLQIIYCELWRWLFALGLILGPWGSIRMGQHKKYNWTRLVAITLSIHILFYTAYAASANYLAAIYLQHQHIGLSDLGIDYAWFWPFIVTFSCMLAFYNYCQKGNSHKSMFSELYYPVIGQTSFHWFHATINGFPRYVISGCFALIIALLVMATARATLGADTGLHLSALVNASIIGHMTQRNIIKKLQRPLLKRRLAPALHLLILLTIITLGYGLFYNLFNAIYPQFMPKSYINYAPKLLHQYTQYQAMTYFWLGWWISFTPLLVGWITLCFQGYTLRQILLIVLTPVAVINFLPISGDWPLSTSMNQGVVIVSLIIICLIFLRDQYIPSLYRANLPTTTSFTTPGQGPALLMFLDFGGKALMLLLPFGPKFIGLMTLITGMLFYLFTYPTYIIFGMVLYRYWQGRAPLVSKEPPLQTDTNSA